MTALRVTLAVAAVLLFPAAAHAGSVTSDGQVVTYAGEGENVSLSSDGPALRVSSDRPLAIGAAGCSQPEPTIASCPGSRFQANLTGTGNFLDGDGVTNGATLEAHGGDGSDTITGTINGDTLLGGAGVDTLNGAAGNDTIDAGLGGGEITDGPGDDTILGGDGGDNWTAGPGRDSFTPGNGSDSVSYAQRGNPVTITLDGVADDGEAGEGDNAGTAEDAIGGAGNDRIVGNDFGGRLYGGPGDDAITGGRAEDRLEGNEGNDTIDSRDGRYDSVDCGPGSDVVFADPDDATVGCEVAPDVDGDGYLPPQDCAPTNPAVHPGAGEIVGNNVDEDCAGGPGYLRVVSPVSFSTQRDKRRNLARFTKFTVGEVKAGDRIEIRCTSKRKGCAFTRKTVTGKTGKRTVNLLAYFKQRSLRKGAVVEIRSTRPNEIGAVRRLTVGKAGNIKIELLCLAPGAPKPSRCA
jgi:Ca2+-binding RTX toxin-like protein